MKTTISASIEEEEAIQLAQHSKLRKRSQRQLAGFAVAEWLQRNEHELTNGSKPKRKRP